ncbi:MAG TPA: hypothetical protein VFK20_08630 [Vicinamibacterales bacterium]|nr:hypothetical protein [Vicinamibacterales bacterium]
MNDVVWLSGSVTVATWLNVGAHVNVVVTASTVPVSRVTDVTSPACRSAA